MKEKFKLSIFAAVGSVLLMVSGFMPLTKTNIGSWSGADTSYEIGILFVVAGIIGMVLVMLKGKKLFLIPAIIAILGAMFLRGILSVYGSFISYTIWYYLIWVGSILMIVQAFVQKGAFK